MQSIQVAQDIANRQATFWAAPPHPSSSSVAYKAVVYVAADLVAQGYRGIVLGLDENLDAEEIKKRKNAADSRAKAITEATFRDCGVKGYVHAAEGFKDEVDDVFMASELINPTGLQGALHVLSDVIEGTNALAGNNNQKTRQEILASESGATSTLVVGDGLITLGNAPDIYAEQIFSLVPPAREAKVQATAQEFLTAEDPQPIRRVLEAIALANGLGVGDLEVVLMKRPRESKRFASLSEIQKSHPGLQITCIPDGTLAHGLLANLGVKQGCGKHKILWTVGGSTEGFMNLAIAASIPGAIAALRLYSLNVNKAPDGAKAQNLQRRYDFNAQEIEQLGHIREDAQSILEGKRLFSKTDTRGAIEGYFSFITDSGVFQQPGVIQIAPKVFRVNTLRVCEGKGHILVEDIDCEKILGLLS